MKDAEKVRILATLPPPALTTRSCYTSANRDRGPTRHFWTLEGDTVKVLSFWIEDGQIKSAVKTRGATDADR